MKTNGKMNGIGSKIKKIKTEERKRRKIKIDLNNINMIKKLELRIQAYFESYKTSLYVKVI